MKQLFCDCKTDKEKANFFLSGRAVETGIVAPAISNDVAMAYHRCAEFQKEIDALRAMIEQMKQQEPIGWLDDGDLRALEYGNSVWLNPDDQGRMIPVYLTAPESKP